MKHAGFWRQVTAVIIDQLAIMLPSTIIPEIYYFIAAANGVDPVRAQVYSDVMIVCLAAVLCLSYYIFLNGRYGVTLGRRLLNMKLVRLDRPNGDGIGYGRAAVRLIFFALVGGFVRVAAFVSVPAPLGILFDAITGATILWLLIDPRRRTLEDKVMGTVLVHDPSGKFPDFDPDKLPPAKVRPYAFTALVLINALASVYYALNR
jgi:uncharacterized RDD family membrane protein YckC